MTPHIQASNSTSQKGFSLLEVLIVVILIGILSALAWSNISELIQTNKTKEAARTLAAFAERVLAEGKMRKESVFVKVNSNTMEARFRNSSASQPDLTQSLANGFSASSASGPDGCTNFNGTAKSEIRIGISGMQSGCFVVCNASSYCGAAVKTGTKNALIAHIKKKNSNVWEAL